MADRRTTLPRAVLVSLLSVALAPAGTTHSSAASRHLDPACLDGAVGASLAPAAGCGTPGTMAPAVPATAAPAATGSAPRTSTSFYEYSSFIASCADPSSTWNCTPWTQGFETTVAPRGAMVVLDLGAPCFVPTTGAYGTQLFDERACTPFDQETAIVRGFVHGYEAGHGAATGASILAVGVSNSLTAADPQAGYALTAAQLSVHAGLFYDTLVAGMSSGPAPLAVWGADDMEQSSDGNWYGPGDTRAWVNGYGGAAGITAGKPACSASTPGMLADFGDDVVGNGGWQVTDIYYVAWGAPVACAVPEIYYTSMASEWANLNRWAAETGRSQIRFSALMSENDATGRDLTAAASWNALSSATGQGVPYLTTIAWSTRLGWHHFAAAGFGPLGGPPHAVSWGPGHADVFWRGTDGALWHAWYFGGRWTGPQRLGGSLAGDPSPVSWGYGHIDVFWKGTDLQLWHVYFVNGGWHGPEPLGGEPLGSSPHAVTDEVGSIGVFWTGTDADLWEMRYAGGWTDVPVGLRGGPLLSEPQPVAVSPGAVLAFWRGEDHNLWWMDWHGGAWSGPIGMYASNDVQGTPSPVSWGGGHADVFWPRSDGSIWHAWLAAAGAPWAGPALLAQGPAVTRVTSLSFVTGHLQVFWEDATGNLWEDEYGNGWLGPANLGDGPIGSLPTAVAGGDGLVDVLWRGTDPNSSLWHDWHP